MTADNQARSVLTPRNYFTKRELITGFNYIVKDTPHLASPLPKPLRVN